MQVHSKAVTSNQQGLHPRLAEIVLRHLQHHHRSPTASHNTDAWHALARVLAADPRPLVLDSFCGTGMSTALLAARHPRHLVVGIDRSGHRLHRHQNPDGTGYLLLQAECEPIWRQLLAAGVQVDYHYLLYPNPWPKARHLQRRIHGHAAFRELVSLGGILELRSNWQLYVEEFGVSLHLAGVRGIVRELPVQPPLTLFEKKYLSSGQTLWQYCSTGPRGIQPENRFPISDIPD